MKKKIVASTLAFVACCSACAGFVGCGGAGATNNGSTISAKPLTVAQLGEGYQAKYLPDTSSIRQLSGKIDVCLDFEGTQGGWMALAEEYQRLQGNAVIVKIDHRLIEAAEDLGCNTTQVFSRVILPLSIPGILSGITMVFVPAVSTFYISQKLGGTDTMLIGDIIERLFKSAGNPNLGAALSLVLMLLVFICTGVMNRFGGDEEGGVVV